MSKSEKQEFFAQPHVAILAVSQEGRSPLAVPIWYSYEPGGRPWITTGAGSVKMKAIEAAGRFTLTVDTTDPHNKYVSVEGAVVEVRPTTDDEERSIASRYLQGAALDGFLEFSKTLPEHVTVVLEPERWLGADLQI